jgi:hypothetical protein
MGGGVGFCRGRGAAAAAYIAVVPTTGSNGREAAIQWSDGRSTGGGSWALAGWAASCLGPGRLWADLYRAVPRGGLTGRGGGPSTKSLSGRTDTKHF